MSSKNVVFDLVGTLVCYDHMYEAVEARLGARLRSAGVSARLLVNCWIEAAEREYTNLALAGRYAPFHRVFALLFWRVLGLAGVARPRAFASADDLAHLLAEWRRLGMRPGARACVDRLRAAGFTVWGFTAGDLAQVSGYFAAAGIDMPAENLLSCDTDGVAKPMLDAYRPVLRRFEGSTPWFAAAHMWDVSAARQVG